MKTTVTPEDLATSVIAVPPLCWQRDGTLNYEANGQLIAYLEAGGVTNLLYGGNANFYNIPLSDYPTVLDFLAGQVAPNTLVIPSVGPFYSTLQEQARILADRDFPTAMLLPTSTAARPAGLAAAVRRFVDITGKKLVLYIKDIEYMEPRRVGDLVNEGLVSFIKYAVVRPDPANDAYLSELCEYVNPQHIVSGMGEQPAVAHMEKFRLAGFTSGLVCLTPRRSMQLFHMMKDGDFFDANQVRLWWAPLEDLRNLHGPIVVLHHAVAIAAIAETGPQLPMLSGLDASVLAKVKDEAWQLLLFEQGDPNEQAVEADQAGEPEQQNWT